MGSVEMQQGITELRTEAFRLAESLSRSGCGPDALNAATTLQSVAFMLGEVERYLVGTREVEDRLSVA